MRDVPNAYSRGLHALRQLHRRGDTQREAQTPATNPTIPAPNEENEVTTVPLSRGLVAMIDDADAPRVLAHRWRAAKNDRGELFPISSKRRPTIRLSRFILNLERGVEVRHKNGDRFDCRRENLIVETRGDGQHAKPYPTPSSGFRGVYLDRRSGRFEARITREGRCLFLGYHATAEEASRRYAEAEREVYGASCLHLTNPISARL